MRILSIALIGGASGEVPKGATVRFQRSVYNKQNGTSQPLDSKIVTLAFTYKANLRMDEQQRIENPLGFQVTDYRVDTDYASSPPEEVATNPKPVDNLPPMPAPLLAPPADAPSATTPSLNFVAPTGANQGTRRQ